MIIKDPKCINIPYDGFKILDNFLTRFRFNLFKLIKLLKIIQTVTEAQRASPLPFGP